MMDNTQKHQRKKQCTVRLARMRDYFTEKSGPYEPLYLVAKLKVL
jgi:hypothetical protein